MNRSAYSSSQSPLTGVVPGSSPHSRSSTGKSCVQINRRKTLKGTTFHRVDLKLSMCLNMQEHLLGPVYLFQVPAWSIRRLLLPPPPRRLQSRRLLRSSPSTGVILFSRPCPIIAAWLLRRPVDFTRRHPNRTNTACPAPPITNPSRNTILRNDTTPRCSTSRSSNSSNSRHSLRPSSCSCIRLKIKLFRASIAGSTSTTI